MFLTSILSTILLGIANALTLPPHLSILDVANTTFVPDLLQAAEWPPVPWVHNAPATMDLQFISYGRIANPSLARRINSDFDSLIFLVLRPRDPEDVFDSRPLRQAINNVHIDIDFKEPGVRTTTVALALRQIIELMSQMYSFRELEVNIILLEDLRLVATIRVSFLQV